jgi:hypothetical protein
MREIRHKNIQDVNIDQRLDQYNTLSGSKDLLEEIR